YPTPPSAGPDLSVPAPAAGTTLKVRWANGYGTLVTGAGNDEVHFPFVMKRAHEQIRVRLTQAGGPAVGTSEPFLIKPGILSELRFRALANDSAGTSLQYSDPTNTLAEGTTLPFANAGYDGAGNYIQDYVGDWTLSNGKASLIDG